MKVKTRRAYGTHRESGKIFDLGDTIEAALRANMLRTEYEKALIKANPQLDISFRIEEK